MYRRLKEGATYLHEFSLGYGRIIVRRVKTLEDVMKPRFHLTALAACFILCVSVAPAQAAQGTTAPSAAPQVNQLTVSVHDLQSYIKQRAPFILLDVRDAAEYDQGHIPVRS